MPVQPLGVHLFITSLPNIALRANLAESLPILHSVCSAEYLRKTTVMGASFDLSISLDGSSSYLVLTGAIGNGRCGNTKGDSKLRDWADGVKGS